MTEARSASLESMTYRAGQRQPVTLDISVVRDGEPAGTIRVRNLSVYGFMAESRVGLDIGEGILVSVGDEQPRPARVAWAWRGRVGGEFLAPLTDGELTGLMANGGGADQG